MTKTAIVILNYNGRAYLEKFLPFVIKYSSKADIIIADNASTDDSIAFLNASFPKIQLILLKENLGYAGGYNEALKQIEAEYFLLLNSDIEVTSDWLSPLESFLDSNPQYAACQPKIKDYNHRALFEYAGASGGFIDSLGYPFCRGRIFDELESDSGQYNDPIDIFWSSGACMLIRSEVFFKAGGFDQDFFAHMEEIDLCWRIQSMGLKVKAIPSSTVYHVGGGTLDKSSSFKTYLNFRNGLSLLIKNLPLAHLILKLPIRIILDWLAAFKFTLEGRLNHGVAVVKAHFYVIGHFVETLKKRKQTSATPPSKLIVVEYYVKRKRKFSDL
jgi:GT2 family glycosyltransferase